jgi:RHS repeat-associated protein
VGLILDSSVVIAAERQGHTVRQILEQFKTGYGETEIGLSVVTIVELTHGVQRAKLDERRQRRQAFVDELIRDVPVYPVTVETAKLAGRIEGDQAGSTYYNYTYPTGTNIGKVSSIYDAYGGETVTYAYDSLNRMISAAATVGGTATWGETYGYDSFGNLSAKTPTAGTPPTLSQAANQSNNQIVGYSYDANGNQLEAPGFSGSPTYDAENRMVAAPGVQYAYDSRNKRVWSGTINGSNNLTGQTAYFYGVNGQLIGSYSLSLNYGAGQYLEFSDPPATQAVYFGGTRVGTTQSGTTTAYWQDRLGSNRSGGLRYYPWGEARGTNPQDTWNYATYWQDSATGLDYADQRYYGNVQGRFMTPDPYMASGGPSDPGSWNRHAYTRGDPVNRLDPQGLEDLGDDFAGGGIAGYSPAVCNNPSVILALVMSGAQTSSASQYCQQYFSAPYFIAPTIVQVGAPPLPSTCPPKYQAWITAHGADAATVAGQIGTAEADILALSAYESGWGGGPFASMGSYFNLETTKPTTGPNPPPFKYSTGWMQAAQPNQNGRYALVATYSSYLNSAHRSPTTKEASSAM